MDNMIITLEFFRSLLKTKLLSFYIDILRIVSSLPPHERYTNKIFSLSRTKTGFKNKKDITDAIESLKKSEIITVSKATKQKSLIGFLPIGLEIVKLVDDLEKHNKGIVQLKKDIEEYFDLYQGDVTKLSTKLRYYLEQRGWKSEEIPQYHEWLIEVFHIEYYSYFAIFSALTARYASIILRYNLVGLASDILNKLVVDALRDRLLSRSETALSETVMSSTREDMYYRIFSHLASSTNAYFMNYAPPRRLNRFIQESSLDVVRSLYSLLSPPKDHLKRSFGGVANKDEVVRQQLAYLEALNKSS